MQDVDILSVLLPFPLKHLNAKMTGYFSWRSNVRRSASVLFMLSCCVNSVRILYLVGFFPVQNCCWRNSINAKQKISKRKRKKDKIDKSHIKVAYDRAISAALSWWMNKMPYGKTLGSKRRRKIATCRLHCNIHKYAASLLGNGMRYVCLFIMSPYPLKTRTLSIMGSVHETFFFVLV